MARIATFVSPAVLALGLLACGSEQHPVAPYYMPGSGDAAPKGSGSGSGTTSDAKAAKAADKDAAKPAPAATPAPGPASPDPGSSLDPGADDGGMDDGTTADDEAKLVEDCGGIDEAHAADDLINENLRGVAVVAKGKKKIFGPFTQDYTITATPTLVLRATSEVNVASLTVAAVAEPTSAGTEADAAAKKVSGAATTEMLPLRGRAAALAKLKGWEGIVCTVQPARKITVQTGGSNVVVQFDPPLPHSLSPRALMGRFAVELPKDRQWTGITATILSSDNAAAPAGGVFAGVVTLKKIAATGSVVLPDGTATTVGGDAAFELVVDFGGPEITNALGLKPSTKVYLDQRLHRFGALVTDSFLPATEGAPSQTVFLAQ